MKKFFVFLIYLFIVISLQAQTNLFKGITSGISEIEYLQYCSSHPDFTNMGENYFTTTIEGRQYMIGSVFNKKNELTAILFVCFDSYEWMEYDPNIKTNALELYSLLQIKYSNATYDEWLNWTDIPKGKAKTIAMFESQTIIALLSIREKNDMYTVNLSVGDTKYADPVIKNSGGF